jgi:hypothetical protein
MNNGRQFVMTLLVLLLLPAAGCQKKQPQIPNQANAPAEPIPTPLPPEITEETPPPPAPEPEPQPAKVDEPKPQPAKRHKKKPASPPAATAQNSDPNPQSTSSANSSLAAAHPPASPANEAPPDTAIAADVSSAQLLQQKQTTAQLLDATEKTLNGLPHNLSHDEGEMVVQIRSYLAQSRKATTDGDFERAYNLATKAHLLSDALVKK